MLLQCATKHAHSIKNQVDLIAVAR